jgi:hypothetical protein
MLSLHPDQTLSQYQIAPSQFVVPPVGTTQSQARNDRLIEHLILQQSFYPLFPAPAGTQLELRQMGKLSMAQKPDLLVLPTKLNTFAKVIQGTLCVNPGKLTKGNGGGTFAHISVDPLPRQTAKEGGEYTCMGVVLWLRIV